MSFWIASNSNAGIAAMLVSIVFALVLVGNALANCPDGYSYFEGGNTCLKFFTDKKSFKDARTTCQGDGGDLVQVHDDAKATFVGVLHPSVYWMGVWDDDRDRRFSYIDGTPLGSYHPWRRGEPNNSGRNEYCVMVVGYSHRDRKQWNDGNCNAQLPFVCEAKPTRCPPGYSFFEGDNSCLKGFDTTKKKSFNNARTTCQADGGDLVQVHDDAKATFVGGILTSVYWMGVWDDNRDRTFTYIDGTPLGGYHPWRRGEPNNSGRKEYCVMVVGFVHRDRKQWNDGNCNDALPFVCEVKLCPEGYSRYEGDNKCLKSFLERKSYSAARRTCQDDGGDLVEVHDAAKSSFVGDIHPTVYWMGVSDPNGDRKFTYLDGSALGSYKPWMRGEPNNAGRREYCVMVIGRRSPFLGQWNDANCASSFPFVCENKVCSAAGYVRYDGDNTCLKSFDTRKTFAAARQTCQSEGGDLAQIRDSAKAEFIGGLQTGKYWMGVWDSDKDRKFSYVDGIPVTSYHPWSRGEPNNYGRREYCVVVASSVNAYQGRWNDANCNAPLPFVCEK